MKVINKEDILEIAKNHCFFNGLNDSGAELCKANSIYGIAGIHYVQNLIGMEPNATFIFTPDMTITRNVGRWRSGFGYGGKISWGDGNNDLIILNTKPNACGMIIGGLEKLPEIEDLIEKLYEMEKDTIKIDGIKIKWDFYKSNHFIDLFRVEPVENLDFYLSPYFFIIHGSVGELTKDNKAGFGLYFDKSKKLYKMAEHIGTPFGEFHILTGNNAKEYFEMYKYAENFSKRKRKLAAELLFDKFIEISNETHQGLINMNEICLGCHYLKGNNTLFPVVLRGDLLAYLVRGIPNLSPEIIETLGFEKRSRNFGVYDRLLNANIIPHGGGYVLPDSVTVNKVIEVNGTRYFEVDMQNDRGKKIVSEVQELPYEYRGKSVIVRSLESKLINVVAKLIPEYVLKI